MRKKSHISDVDLIKSYLAGDKQALAILVRKWHQTFCKLSYWYTKDPEVSKDIAQECWTVIIKKIDTLEDPAKFKSWAISLVNRRSIDWLRAQHRERTKLQGFYREKQRGDLPQPDTYREQQKLALLRAIQLLTTEQQYVIRLFYVQNYSLHEIAKILEISVGTAKSRLFHAREKLKLIIKNKDHEK